MSAHKLQMFRIKGPNGWQFTMCVRCGLLCLKNAATQKALKKECEPDE